MRDSPVFFTCPDIRVRNLKAAVRFYRQLGLVPEARGKMRDGTSLVWMRSPATGQLLELFRFSRRSPLYRPFRERPPAANALIFATRDPAPVVRTLRRLGAHLLTRFEDGDVALAFLRDPNGVLLEIVGWTELARARTGGVPMAALHRGARPRSAMAPRGNGAQRPNRPTAVRGSRASAVRSRRAGSRLGGQSRGPLPR